MVLDSLLKYVSSLQILLHLISSPNGTLLVRIWLSFPLYIIVSRNGISCSLLLNANFIVGCMLFARCLKSSNACFP